MILRAREARSPCEVGPRIFFTRTSQKYDSVLLDVVLLTFNLRINCILGGVLS